MRNPYSLNYNWTYIGAFQCCISPTGNANRRLDNVAEVIIFWMDRYVRFLSQSQIEREISLYQIYAESTKVEFFPRTSIRKKYNPNLCLVRGVFLCCKSSTRDSYTDTR